MEKYPYEATIIQKEAVKTQGKRISRYAFLADLAKQLGPNQAIQLTVSDRSEQQAIASSWREICKDAEPHTFSHRNKDNSYTLYLWLGPLAEAQERGNK